jgi:hypothetical protein
MLTSDIRVTTSYAYIRHESYYFLCLHQTCQLLLLMLTSDMSVTTSYAYIRHVSYYFLCLLFFLMRLRKYLISLLNMTIMPISDITAWNHLPSIVDCMVLLTMSVLTPIVDVCRWGWTANLDRYDDDDKRDSN